MFTQKVLAQIVSSGEKFSWTRSILDSLGLIINLLTILAFAAALLFFFWGIAVFILKAGDEGAREEGRKKIVWGIVALFVISSIWGIIYLIGNEIGVSNNRGNVSGENIFFPGQNSNTQTWKLKIF